ncbi:MAG: transcriptional regulator [Actinobacteria bacterium]|nr:transcriptional regulator [Actinomycetota bacterium]
MVHTSDPELLVLTALRLKSFAPVEVVAMAAGLPPDETEPILRSLLGRELVKHREGVLTGWLLTPAGRKEGEQRLGAELEVAGARPAVEAAYAQFLPLNSEVLHICTDWQLLGGESSQTLNDHSDADYDAAVISRLAAVDDKVQTILVELASALDRFAGYEPRLSRALARVQAGASSDDGWADWFTKPTIDSYHTVWFELHENLLATLGIERATEGR